MKSLLCLFLFVVLLWCSITSINAQEACSTEGTVRLQGLSSSPDPISGRVEFCWNGVWGTVCGDSASTPWGEKNGQVVCRDLGYSGVLNSILQDRLPAEARAPAGTPINVRSVLCIGHEGALDSCPFTDNNDTCTHDQDVAITCRRGLQNGERGEVGDIRLIGDIRNGYGAVQLRDEDEGFIGICPDDGTFGTTEANIVCRQLGYDSGTVMEFSDSGFESFFPATRAQGFSCDSEDIILTSATCNHGLTTQCTTSSLVGVACESSSLPDGTIRLFGGGTNTEGRVEIFFNGKWGRICDEGWSDTDGAVACEELGFGSDNVSTFGTDNFRGASNTIQPIWLNELECVPTSGSLNECPHLEPTGFADCDSSDDAILDCAALACDVENCLGCVDANICEECEDGFEEDGQGACMEGGGATAGITRATLLGGIAIALYAVCYGI